MTTTAKRNVSKYRTSRRAAMPNDAPKTLDVGSRTVRAIIATDEPVLIWDSGVGDWCDEVLIPAGFVAPEKMKLREDHGRYRSRAVIGRVFDFTIRARELEATLRFNRAGDVDQIWQRVAEGDIDSVSIGATYRLADSVLLEPGQSKKIGSITYKAASDRYMRIVTTWQGDETSIVDEPADKRSTIRSAIGTGVRNEIRLKPRHDGASLTEEQTEGQDMTKRVSNTAVAKRKANAQTVATQNAQRAARKRTRAAVVEDIDDEIANNDDEIATVTNDDDNDNDENGVERSEKRLSRLEKMIEGITKRAKKQVDENDEEVDDVEAAIERATTAERKRVARIRELGVGQSDRLVNQAIEEGWTPEQFGVAALERTARRSERNPTRQTGDGINRAPAGHVRGGDIDVDTMQAAVLMRAGINLQNPHFATEAGRTILERAGCGWLSRFNAEISDEGRSDVEQIVDRARRYRSDSAARTCERIVDRYTKNGSAGDIEETVQRAFSSPYLPRVFGAVVSAGLVQGFMSYADSTVGWVSETDWADFRNNQPIGIDGVSGLKKHTRNSTAKDVDFADWGEAYAVARYTGAFKLDDMDIVDDVVGANQMLPTQMGYLAARLRPDLVYAILLSNPTLTDGTALFHASRGNLVTSNALSVAGLTAAEAAMATRTVANKTGNKVMPLNLMAGHLIVPRTLRTTGKQIVTSSTVVHGNTTQTGNRNPHDGEYSLHSDARLDAGVTDPRNDQSVAGSTSSWYIAESTGQNTLQVGYRRGTGRAPQIRVRPLTAVGEFGIGWDIAFDIGCGVLSPKGLVKSNA